MTDEQLSPAQSAYRAALRDAVDTAERLKAEGLEARAFGLATAVDLGTSAAFLFSITERDYENATKIVREAITQATREED